MKALSIAGPFAYCLATGWKTVELRSWRTSYRGLVLLHTSSTRDWDYAFEYLNLVLDDCPKAAIQGAGTLVDCVEYASARQWDADIDKHRWVGDQSYGWIKRECYGGKNPIGHVFENPVLFEEPIWDVPGARNYWTPAKTKQAIAFQQAAELLSC